VCTEDVLALRFEASGSPVVEIGDFEPGIQLKADVVLETKSTAIQGWSYGVRHDRGVLSIESVTTDGTDAGLAFQGGFNATRFENIVDCGSDTRCEDPQPGSGFISAVVLSFLQPAELPIGVNSLARATYRLEPAAGEVESTGIIELTEQLANRNSPPAPITFTVQGKSTRPRTLIDGKIIVSPSSEPFHRGDPDADGRLSVADSIALLLFLFLAGPAPGCLDAGDVDDDGRIDTTDPVLVLRWLFLEGTAPAAPGPPPGPCDLDPPGSNLGCDTYGAC
jgi:hypothetical protein